MTTGVFAVCALVSAVNPSLGMFGLFLLLGVRFIERSLISPRARARKG